MEQIKLLNKAETAEMLRIKPVTLDRMTKAGTGPAPTKIGAKVFFEPKHIRSWIDAKHK